MPCRKVLQLFSKLIFRYHRERELLSRLRTLDAEGMQIDQEYRRFRTEHMILERGRLEYVAADFLTRMNLQTEKLRLERRAGEIDTERSSILSELVRLANEREAKHAS